VEGVVIAAPQLNMLGMRASVRRVAAEVPHDRAKERCEAGTGACDERIRAPGKRWREVLCVD
jgi:hypothetical protein